MKLFATVVHVHRFRRTMPFPHVSSLALCSTVIFLSPFVDCFVPHLPNGVLPRAASIITGRQHRLRIVPAMQVLNDQQRLKDNPAPDEYFYDYPRFCYHADAEFHAELTSLYEKELPYGPNTRVLDMMSSWVSHYPTDRSWGRVDAIGMNIEELQRNPQVDFAEVWDLNVNSTLPFPDCTFDAVTCALSVQYLTYPETVVNDIGRVLKPGGKVVFSFSNRMFPSKAVYGWRQRREGQRVELVQSFFRSSPHFEAPRAVDKSTLLHRISYLSMYYLGRPLTTDPFYAVVAQKKP